MVTETLTLGTAFAQSGKAKPVKGRGRQGPTFDLPDFDVKTLLTTSAGFAPESTREPLVVGAATREPRLLDLIPSLPTGQNLIKYMEETTFTNAAAETAEGGTFPESTFVHTERSSAVQRVSTFIPVTDEELEDAEALGPWLDQRLPFALRQRLEAQLVSGNGTAPNLRGILNVVGIQTQALGADTREVAIRKAATKIRTPGEALPTAILLNPLDAEDMDVAAAADKVVAYLDDGELWNLPKIQSTALTAGTGIVLDTNYAALRVRRGATVSIANQHSTFFVEGKQAVRVDMRVAFFLTRPSAACTITGI